MFCCFETLYCNIKFKQTEVLRVKRGQISELLMQWMCIKKCLYLKAVILAEDGAVHWFNKDLLLHAEVQSFDCTGGTEQRLVRARLLQPGHQMRPDTETHNNQSLKWFSVNTSVYIEYKNRWSNVFIYGNHKSAITAQTPGVIWRRVFHPRTFTQMLKQQTLQVPFKEYGILEFQNKLWLSNSIQIIFIFLHYFAI